METAGKLHLRWSEPDKRTSRVFTETPLLRAAQGTGASRGRRSGQGTPSHPGLCATGHRTWHNPPWWRCLKKLEVSQIWHKRKGVTRPRSTGCSKKSCALWQNPSLDSYNSANFHLETKVRAVSDFLGPELFETGLTFVSKWKLTELLLSKLVFCQTAQLFLEHPVHIYTCYMHTYYIHTYTNTT